MNRTVVKWAMQSINLWKKYSLLITILLCTLGYQYVPPTLTRCIVTFSAVMRELLVAILPFMLLSFIATALRAIPRESAKLVGMVMGCVVLFNFINIMLSGVLGFALLKDSAVHACELHNASANYKEYFSLGLPKVLSVTWALCLGIVIGIGNSFWRNEMVDRVIKVMHDCVQLFLKKFFVPLLPLFVMGFLLKMLKEGYIGAFLEHNLLPCVLMCLFLWGYIIFLLFAVSGFKKDEAIRIAKNASLPVITAFSTMSSAAALPFSIQAAKENTGDEVLAESVMPLTMNFHMVGDTIVIPIMMMMVLGMFGRDMPCVSNFVLFAVLFVLNKFAGGGVPSGSIMVAVPILEKYFSFDANMTGFIITFYSVIDPIATSANVAANNLFVVFFHKMRGYVRKYIAIGEEGTFNVEGDGL